MLIILFSFAVHAYTPAHFEVGKCIRNYQDNDRAKTVYQIKRKDNSTYFTIIIQEKRNALFITDEAFLNKDGTKSWEFAGTRLLNKKLANQNYYIVPCPQI